VFIQIIQGRCTQRNALRKMSDDWQRDMGPHVDGYLGATYGFTDDDMFVGVVRFDSKEAATANSVRPEQTAWAERMTELFDGPVEFHDCNDVTLMMDGGSNNAGFVQIMRGTVDDPEKLKSMLGQTDMLHEIRPEILGATLAIEDDGTFTQTIAFSDEDSARRGEQKEMPAEIRETLESAMRDVSYMDLHHPWFA
jgi:hypothetical protein